MGRSVGNNHSLEEEIHQNENSFSFFSCQAYYLCLKDRTLSSKMKKLLEDLEEMVHQQMQIASVNLTLMKLGETVKQNTKEFAGVTWRKTNMKGVETYLETLDLTGPGQPVILIDS